jgi:ABC-type sugar transport system permease subunit
MLELLAGFIAELRQAGLPVSLTENLDAMEAVKHIPLEDREAFKYAKFGYATALSMIFGTLLFTISLFQMWLSRKIGIRSA